MRPTGKLHLGNYMGALANWVKLQDQYECYFFIADWHALTTDYADTSQIAANIKEVMLDYLAAGLDPAKSVLFLQSRCRSTPNCRSSRHEHSARLAGARAQLQGDAGEPGQQDLTTYGFLGYPVLMAADILLYQPRLCARRPGSAGARRAHARDRAAVQPMLSKDNEQT